MKTIFKYFSFLSIMIISFYGCDKNDYNLETEISELGNLLTPNSGNQLVIDVENGENINFTWSEATSKDGGLVTYKVLFDKEGGDFSEPISTFSSSGNGAKTFLTLQQVYLNIMASKAGIQQLDSGNIIWTVKVSSGFNEKLFPENAKITLTRPEGLAVFPEYMYIYGDATEQSNLTNSIAFKQISNKFPNDDIQPGTFETITKMEPGSFFITNTNDSNDPDLTNYYLNSNGKIRQGNTESTFNLPEGVYRIRMNLATSTISYKLIENIELYILASQTTRAVFEYVGNHTFEATDGYFDFLEPGSPGAPSWLSWQEERYRFRFEIDGNVSYIGSFHNEDMNGSLVPGFDAYNLRPNGDEPNYYNNIYFIGEDAPYWQSAYKFGDAYDEASFTCRLVFDPKADEYYSEFNLN